MDKTTHQIRCEQWTKIFNEWAVSSMNKNAWCKENGISTKSFFYWQRILRNESYIDSALSVSQGEAQKNLPVAFVELKLTSEKITQRHPGFVLTLLSSVKILCWKYRTLHLLNY